MMKGLVTYFVENRAITYFLVALLAFGGLASFFQLGQLEDPKFTVKKALVITYYPGASAEEVELEVTDRLEKGIQELTQLKAMWSISQPGISAIRVEIEEEYWSDRLPQVWDEMRKKLRDVSVDLPPGAGKPDISDDFNFVYGFVLAVTGDGFSYKALEDYADALKKDLSLVQGVARVELWGVQNEVIYIDVSEKELSERGLNAEDVARTLRYQNLVVDSGMVDAATNRFRIDVAGTFQHPEDIADLVIRPNVLNQLQQPVDPTGQFPAGASPGGAALTFGNVSSTYEVRDQELIRVRDIGTVQVGYLQPPKSLMRFWEPGLNESVPSIGIQIAGREDQNIVEVGARLDNRLREIQGNFPHGLEVSKITWQAELVSNAVNGFLINLAEAVGIVLVVLIIPSGLRMGLVIGLDLVLTILGTLIVMLVMDIPLQRMSLGALIIAMGMMVDNSIVVADAIAVKMRQGMDPKQAAIESAVSPSWPLLSATLVASLAFYPIFASTSDSGEYCRTLFTVIASALILSWLVAMFITPLQCLDMLPKPKPAKEGEDGEVVDEFDQGFYKVFKRILGGAIRVRWMTLGVMAALLAVAVVGFGSVRQMFFPDAQRPQLMIDYWAPNGTRIQQVSADLRRLEEEIRHYENAEGREVVTGISTFMGGGPPRFYLPVDPEWNVYPNYAELVVNFESLDELQPFAKYFETWSAENVPDATVRTRLFGVGVVDTWKWELRISGPAEADMGTARRLADEVVAIMEGSERSKEMRPDIMNRVKKVVPEYDEARARWAGITREDVARTTKRSYDGRQVGLYREGDDIYPILLRHVEAERTASLNDFGALQVQPEGTTVTAPLSTVTSDIRSEWEEHLISRWNRRRGVTVHASPVLGYTYPEQKAEIIDQIEAMELPQGWTMFWDGEDDSTRIGVDSLIPGIIPAVVLIVFLILTVFKAYKPLMIILLTIPFALIGITAAMLALDTPFGFLAILGAMSLAGMMNKNIVVLLDAVNDNLAAGMSRYDAIVGSAVSRLRPVLLAAGTTVLGVIPLVPDLFWTAMAVTIMGGLTVGSILTLVLVPVLYCVFYKVPNPDKAAG